MKEYLCAMAMLAACSATAAAEAQQSEDRAVIEKAIQSYVAAFNTRDARKLAAHWSPEAVYTSRISGSEVTGRDALAKEFAEQLEGMPGARLQVASDSIDFVSPNVALESGTAVVITPEADPSESTYQAVYVKRDGIWLIDRVSEEEPPAAPPSNYERLKDLEWMVGDWVDADGGSVIKTECQWTRNRNYLVRAFTASVEDRVNISGMQLIGWDPAEDRIRSWVFDSDGGFAEGTWSQRDGRWFVQTNATLPDGSRASSTSILQPLDDERFSWQKVNRVVDGEILPSVAEVVIVRQQ